MVHDRILHISVDSSFILKGYLSVFVCLFLLCLFLFFFLSALVDSLFLGLFVIFPVYYFSAALNHLSIKSPPHLDTCWNCCKPLIHARIKDR